MVSNEPKKDQQCSFQLKNESNLKHLDNDIIRIGFMMILEKLTE